jgi:predicted transcriptional regulator
LWSALIKEGFGDLSGEDVTIGHVYEAISDIDQHGMVRIIDQREALKQDTLKAWEEFQATGLHATAEEVDKWLASWGDGNELPAPVCHQ